MTSADDLMPFVLAAMNWRDDEVWTDKSVLADPQVAHYVLGWTRPGDAGVIAESDGAAIGAAWWRTFTSANPGYGYVADGVPELGLAVFAAHRGKGVAMALMTALVERARVEGVPALSLSVEDGNDAARKLYDSLGFVAVGRVGNSDALLLRIA
jgi:ribosomal protein S18 acetylase RimI-like enzyme